MGLGDDPFFVRLCEEEPTTGVNCPSILLHRMTSAPDLTESTCIRSEASLYGTGESMQSLKGGSRSWSVSTCEGEGQEEFRVSRKREIASAITLASPSTWFTTKPNVQCSCREEVIRAMCLVRGSEEDNPFVAQAQAAALSE